MSSTTLIFNTNPMNNKRGIKVNWPVVSTRVSPEMREKLTNKHPNNGDISKVLKALITRYLDGKIIGLKLES
jgi:hypothetical protein